MCKITESKEEVVAIDRKFCLEVYLYLIPAIWDADDFVYLKFVYLYNTCT